MSQPLPAPCPFCDHVGVRLECVVRRSPILGKRNHFSERCENCGAQGPEAGSGVFARTKWNKRSATFGASSDAKDSAPGLLNQETPPSESTAIAGDRAVSDGGSGLESPPNDARVYPCADCGLMRSKAEGGTVFTVCDTCWDKHWKKTQ